MREQWLGRVLSRLHGAESGTRPEAVQGTAALLDVLSLLEAREPGIDHVALAASGLVFLHRFKPTAGSDSLHEFVAAAQLLAPIYVQDADAVPAIISAFYNSGIDPWEVFSARTGFTTDPETWKRMSGASFRQFLATDEVDDLRAAVCAMRLARTAAGPEHPELLRITAMIGSQLAALCNKDPRPAYLRESAETAAFVLDRIGPQDPDRRLHLGNLGSSALRLARATSDPQWARTAYEAFHEVVELEGDDDERRADDLFLAAVEISGLSGDGGPMLEMLRWPATGSARQQRFLAHLSRLPQHVDILIDFCRDAVDHEPPDTLADLPALRVLCPLIAKRAEGRPGTIQATSEAAAYGRRALALARAHDPGAVAECAVNTASVLVPLAQKTQDVDLAWEAVALAREGVEQWAAAGRPEASLARGVLAAANQVVFEAVGDLEAQREALHASSLAVSALDPDDDEYHADLVITHAGILHRYASRVLDVAMLREAVAALRRAYELPGLAEERRVYCLCNMIELLTDLHVLGDRDIETAREAVAVGEQALAVASGGDRAGPFVRGALVRAQRILAEAEDDPERLATAVALADEVLASPETASAATLAAVRMERARTLHAIAARTGAAGTAAEALAALEAVADDPAIRAAMRMSAALIVVGWGRGSGARNLDQLDTAVNLLRINVLTGPLRSDREQSLRSYSGITGQIVAAGVDAADPVRLVGLLERCRGLLSEDTAGLHAGPGPLDPAVAEELERIGDALRALESRDWAAQAQTGPRDREFDRAIARERIALMERRAQLRDELDYTPGAVELAGLAAAGPVVVVAAIDECGYALLITGDPQEPVRIIALPDLSFDEASDRVLTFLTARHFATDTRYPLRVCQQAQAEVRDTLAWLWDAAAAPILAALGLPANHEAAAWPRVWWSPLGFLSYLPWHAAGTGIGESVLDRAVSSYTTSLRALARMRTTPAAASGGETSEGRTLIVAAPKVSSASRLSGVQTEIDDLARLLPDATLLAGPTATKAALLAALGDHTSIHLACHGMTNVHAPGTSKLLLTDHESDPLTVADITGLRLPGRDLAMLSACSTSEVSPDLTDEALHLTAAFQLAGFRHVIGALWPVSDATAGTVSREVYAHLTDSGRRRPRTEDSALALHTAIRGLRKASPAVPTVWASYVHMGV